MGEIPPDYDDCPRVCPFGDSAKCHDCPAKAEEDNFKENLEFALKESLGKDAEKYSINSLIKTVIDISELSESTARTSWTIMTDYLVKILRDERRKLKRILEWNARKNTDQ
ncbi:MAG: hypothetical protein LUM44_09750 [Pyrinomonadaceae bacterium]|nr:hypothetical protein [Pyrinomonadaceae bacterium]